QDLRRLVQALAVRRRFEDAALIGALALEHAGGIVQGVGEDMDLGVTPWHQLAVEPDDAVAIVEGQHAHGGAFRVRGVRLLLPSVPESGKYVNMADIKSPANPLFLREEDLRQGIELLFYAYRDFTIEADALLLQYNFGRAHHRVIYFVGRNPGMPVAALLDILKITKQSLSRVLGQLVRQGFIIQRPGPRDRRQRLLELTTQGAELERRLTARQRARGA